jgi:hypothetical protein
LGWLTQTPWRGVGVGACFILVSGRFVGVWRGGLRGRAAQDGVNARNARSRESETRWRHTGCVLTCFILMGPALPAHRRQPACKNSSKRFPYC